MDLRCFSGLGDIACVGVFHWSVFVYRLGGLGISVIWGICAFQWTSGFGYFSGISVCGFVFFNGMASGLVFCRCFDGLGGCGYVDRVVKGVM